MALAVADLHGYLVRDNIARVVVKWRRPSPVMHLCALYLCKPLIQERFRRRDNNGQSVSPLAPVQYLFRATVLWNSHQAGGLAAISRWSSAANTTGRP